MMKNSDEERNCDEEIPEKIQMQNNSHEEISDKENQI